MRLDAAASIMKSAVAHKATRFASEPHGITEARARICKGISSHLVITLTVSNRHTLGRYISTHRYCEMAFLCGHPDRPA